MTSELLRVNTSSCFICVFLLPSILALSWLRFSPVPSLFKLNTWLLGHGLAVTLATKWYSNPKKVVTIFLPQMILFRKGAQIIADLSPNNNTWLFVAVNLISFILTLYSYEKVPKLFPKSFSSCELIIITQCVAPLFSQSLICFLLQVVNGGKDGFCSTNSEYLVLQNLLIGFCGLCVTFHIFTKLRRSPIASYATIITWLLVTYLFIWLSLKSQEPITWLIQFLTISETRVKVYTSWIALLLSSITYAKVSSEGSTVKRKFFHLVMVMVFVIGIKYDIECLSFSCGCLLYILATIEVIRLLKLPPLGEQIESTFSVFRDEKDTGLLTLSHIYLLLGFILPIWISPSFETSHLLMSSGIITTGIGDTASSFFGKKFGRHKWSGSSKSYEGTIAFLVVSLIATFSLCCYFGLTFNLSQWLVLTTITALVAIIEAKTVQIDNLILPLYFHFLVVLCSWCKML